MGLREKFDEANTTRDGRLTKQQADTASMLQVVANFDEMDTARVGYVTFEQVKSFKGGKKTSSAEAKAKKASVAKVRETKQKVAIRRAAGVNEADIEKRFRRANVTGDGKLTRQQIGLAGNGPLGDHFDELDVEKKGYLTLAQVMAFAHKLAAGHVTS